MTFLWHDYETFGTHPAFDRPSQFAAIRTDDALEPVGEPLCVFCKPAPDVLPHPMACLVTGITPQRAEREGVVEAEFARRVHDELSEPGTCGVGYNSLKFDDEFSRNLFYRNFHDPYRREWDQGNSRWDLIGLARMAYALRPDGLTWPEHAPGRPSFRLEDLTAANGIEHEGAHDALVDVRATIELARRLRRAQPRLWDWALSLRDQRAASGLLNAERPSMLVHTSSRIPAERGCTTLVLPLALQPERPKSVIVFDLMDDPEPLLTLSAADIAERVFTRTADLPEDVGRIALKTVATNRVPMLAPAGVLDGVDTGRIGLDPNRCEANAATLLAHLDAVRAKLRDVYAPRPPLPPGDPEAMIYRGEFFGHADKALMADVRAATPAELGRRDWPFRDPRLPTMLFRYRARNYPDSLTEEEARRWHADRLRRLQAPPEDGQLGLDAFEREMAEAREIAVGDAARERILDRVESWVEGLKADEAP